MDQKVKVLGKEYDVDEAEAKMRGHISWLYWIAGLTLVNIAYIYFDSDYFMVAGLGLDSFLASYVATSEEGFYSTQRYLGIAFVAYFVFSAYLAQQKNIGAVIAAIVLYTADTALFATVYFDVMSLAFHVWATVSLVLGAMFMSQLNQVRDKGPISGDIT
jgi:hypothetical protein